MTITIDAVFENGVFRPLQPVSLLPNQQIQITFSETMPSEPEPMTYPRLPPSEYVDDSSDFTDEERDYAPVPPKSTHTIQASGTFAGQLKPRPYPEDENR